MISVIMPVLNESKVLAKTLQALVAQPHVSEVIIVDGGSTDSTEQTTRQWSTQLPGYYWLDCRAGRAIQQNTGALKASGKWLLFLHADTLLPPQATTLIANQPTDSVYGCFRHRFSSSSHLLALASLLNNMRTQLTRVAYGDQAMFIHRELFIARGMFPEQLMEDARFSLMMRDTHRLSILDETVVTDSRKFDQIGHWRALWWATCLLWHFGRGRDIDHHPFFDDYR